MTVWRGFQARRADFDQRLLNTARALGVQSMERTPAKAIVMRRSRVAGVATGHSVVSADYVIDATGDDALARETTRHSSHAPLAAVDGALRLRIRCACRQTASHPFARRQLDVDGGHRTWRARLGARHHARSRATGELAP
jgi:glycine/D-amino acid oxidase-like deaminating enzyme